MCITLNIILNFNIKLNRIMLISCIIILGYDVNIYSVIIFFNALILLAVSSFSIMSFSTAFTPCITVV